MKDENQKDQEQIRLENELKKINLEMEHGMQAFFGSDDLPPELEAMFLDNIAKFEAQHVKGKQITVYDFIGRPDVIPVEQVQQAEEQIARLLKILEGKGISIDRPEHLTSIGYYRFLTEDFFAHQMTDYQVEGMIHGFLYSEFRHDGPEFIQAHVEDFLLNLLNLNKPFETNWLSESCRSERENMTKEEVLDCVQRFRSQYDELIPLAFEKNDLVYNEGFMYLMFAIAWEGRVVGANESQRHEGMGIAQLFLENGEWMIQGIQMPDFQFEK
ncbi:MAG: hypothetical protein AAF847_03435 [Bacteroidota bacterium]